jgi:plastocyanin
MPRTWIAFAALLGLALALPASAATHNVTVSSFVFTPDSLTIDLGDTVEWTWVSGTHTVTSGTGAADPNVGALFDEALNSGSVSFSYTFNDTAGAYPYFCRFHESRGMKGVVVVQGVQVSVPESRRGAASWSWIKRVFR